MARLVIGHIQGKPIYRDIGPARGRVSGDGLSARGYALMGGSLVQPERVPVAVEADDPAERDRIKSKRYYERNRQAILERQRAAWARRKGAA